MPRETLASLRNEIARLQADAYRATMYSCIASDEASGIAPDATETFADGDWRYEMTLWRATGAVCGLVRIVGRYPGQRASVDVRRLDLMQDSRWASLDWRCAVDRLTIARNRLLDARYRAA